jgi:hypothetical protein
MKRPLSLLPLVLLTVSCGYHATPNQITVATGEIATVQILSYDYYSGERPVPCVSSDPSVMTVSQSGNEGNVVIHALHPGVAMIQPVANPAVNLVTVTVFECPRPLIQPSASFVESRVGQPLLLSVTTSGTQDVNTAWYLENAAGSWIPVNPDGKSYMFTPTMSGTYHFRIEYTDRCGLASTDITVVVSTRTRAVRH